MIPFSDLCTQPPRAELRVVSSRFKHLLRQEAHLPPGARELLADQLAVIESMEAELGPDPFQPGGFEDLVDHCHRLINEVQRLHLVSHLRHASRAPFLV